MATKYVSSSGSNSNPGTIVSPYLDLKYALTQVSAGDTISILSNLSGVDNIIDSQTIFVPSGTSTNRISIKANSGRITITVPDGHHGLRAYVNQVSYLTFQGIVYDSTNVTTDWDTILLNTADNIIFVDCEAKNNNFSNGVHTTENSHDITWIGGSVHDITSPDGFVHGLYITGYDSAFIGVEVYNCAAYGFHVYNNHGPHTTPSNVRIEDCIIHDIGLLRLDAAGIVFAWGSNNQAINNVIYNCPVGIQNYTLVSDCKYYFNAIYNCGIAIWEQYYNTVGTYKGNITYGNTENYHDYNTGNTTLPSGNFGSGNPLWVNAAGHDFHLTSTSPCIGIGPTGTGVTLDADGVTRTSPPDMGPFQFAAPAATGTIKVIKVTSPGGDPQSFTFTAAGGLSPTTFSLTDGVEQDFVGIPARSGYSIVEGAVSGWTTSYSVSNGSPNTNISVADGEVVTVTVTNTKLALGTIVVTKVTNPLADPQSFNFTVVGLSPSTFSLTDGNSQTFNNVTPGSGYSISEAAVSQWNVSYSVSNGSPRTNITVAPGETVTVTVTNTKIFPLLGSINVIKVTNPSASAQVFDFTGSSGLSPNTFSLSDGQNELFNNLTPGSGYFIVETPVDGWVTSYSVSNGSPNTNITVGPNEAVVVTVTNTQVVVTPSSGIYKIVPGSGKASDSIWNGDFSGFTEVKIPDPLAKIVGVGR